MLTERQDRILKIIVEDYVKTIRPISSSKINKLINCSSATIRNEMAHLEELGLLEKDQFASGRTPSEAGYKYYVANLMKPKDMTGDDMLKLQTIFKNNSLALSDTIRKSIAIVSEITNYTSIVLGTDAKENKLKKVEVIPLEDAKILTMVITDKGVVEHKNLYLPSTISLEDVTKTVELINQHEVLYNAFYNAFSEFSNSSADVCFAGKSNFLNQPEFSDVGKLKELMSKFDDVNNIKKEEKNGINIYVGKDSEISDDVSVVKTKYNINGEEGTIAIVGPKRMEYDRVVSLLDYIKENIVGNDE